MSRHINSPDFHERTCFACGAEDAPPLCREQKDYLHIALKVARSHAHETAELTYSKGIGLLRNI
jgi:hypothetical protein